MDVFPLTYQVVSSVLISRVFRKGNKETQRDEKMKTKLHSLLLTAALTLSAAAAYGQNQVVANIPFSFRTIAGVQPAGHYAVSHEGEVTKLRNLDSGKASLAGIGVPDDNDRSKPAQLVFTCGSQSGCALTSVRLADGRSWSHEARHLKPSEEARVAVIYLESKQAELYPSQRRVKTARVSSVRSGGP